MTPALFLAFALMIAALQGLSLLITALETAAQRIEGRSTWTAQNGKKFEEFAVTELETSRIMQRDFQESGADMAWDNVVPAHS